MVELDSEGELTRREVADFLREFADELEDGAAVGLGDAGKEEFDDEPEIIGEPTSAGSRDERGEEGPDAEARNLKRITLIVGGDSATVSVPGTMAFDVEVASRSPMLKSGVSQGIEFELSWEIDNPDDLREEWLEVE